MYTRYEVETGCLGWLPGRPTDPRVRFRAQDPYTGPGTSTRGWADYDEAGTRVRISGDLSADDPRLPVWDRAAKEAVGRLAESGLRVGLPLYIRFGRLPKGGKSKNHATGEREKGTSAYRGEYDLNTGLIRFSSENGLSGAALSYLIEGRQAYLVMGEEISTGSDGEPLLQDISVIGRLKPERDGFRLARKRGGGK